MLAEAIIIGALISAPFQMRNEGAPAALVTLHDGSYCTINHSQIFKVLGAADTVWADGSGSAWQWGLEVVVAKKGRPWDCQVGTKFVTSFPDFDIDHDEGDQRWTIRSPGYIQPWVLADEWRQQLYCDLNVIACSAQ